MKTIENIDEPILDLEGAPLRDPKGLPIAAKGLMSQCLARGQSPGQEVRAMMIAMAIHNANGSVDLEDGDFEILKAAVGADQLLNNLAKAGVLTRLEG